MWKTFKEYYLDVDVWRHALVINLTIISVFLMWTGIKCVVSGQAPPNPFVQEGKAPKKPS
jgi:hypothetical protein